MTLIQRAAQRWRDWRLEREIRVCSALMNAALIQYGVNSPLFRKFAAQHDTLHSKRSPSQLARMAKGQG